MRRPDDVWRSQSTAADASRTIIALRVLLLSAEQYLSFSQTGLRVCKRSRNSASVGFSAISLISAKQIVRKRHARQGRRAPSDCGVTRRVHCEGESSSSCLEHDFHV